ncbi:membrane protein insertase YidC [Tundrisphaera lichenicola]|uniref:membrane protein insertase YidC n=1 Tax=Tundrisphaera lichenicola TaxID=2029860 RepID=UPI003EBB67DB
MSSEKRLVLTLVLTLGSVYGIQFAMEKAGWLPPPSPPAVKKAPALAKNEPVEKNEPAASKDDAAPSVAAGELPDKPFAPEDTVPPAEAATPPPPSGPKLVDPAALVLGSDATDDPSDYRLRLVLNQEGAAVQSATSARFEAEIDPGAPRPKGRLPRLKLIGDVPKSDAPGSLSMTLSAPARLDPDAAEEPAVTAGPLEAFLDKIPWEVVRDSDDAPIVRTSTRPNPITKAETEFQEIAFRTKGGACPVTVTKTYRIWKGQDGFEVELKFSGQEDAKFSYRLFGPHGIPIEGLWYTSTFRDVFVGQVKGASTDVATLSSSDVVKYENDPAYRYSALPLKFAGVENQYFATFVEPWPIPTSNESRWDQESGPVVFGLNKEETQKSDVGVEILSKPIVVGPNLGEVVHTYQVYAGPKVSAALLPYEADELSSYRKNQWITIPFAATLAKSVIAPLLDRIYALTQSVARMFGWKNGNYGIAIILLTMTVRLIMFPLGRKQAMMAKKMQDLQPVLAEVKEKYKDDKEALTRETMAVWKRHKVNPAAGCLPALIQMPIFVGLWQSLNNSVALRHSTFLYIRDLAAPDMLFKFPMTLPFVGEYFNLLPFLVVSLMLIQTKLFSPPPTTPEAEMNQKMMKYMMVFMAFMFYKVPSGLGLYFITSSLWQIGERLLLPKFMSKTPTVPLEDDTTGNDKGRGPGGGPGGNGRGPSGNGSGPGGNAVNAKGVQGWVGKRLEKLLEEAAQDKTIRNDDRDRERDRDRGRPKPRPGKRR